MKASQNAKKGKKKRKGRFKAMATLLCSYVSLRSEHESSCKRTFPKAPGHLDKSASSFRRS